MNTDQSLKDWIAGFQASFNRAILVDEEIRQSLFETVTSGIWRLEKESVEDKKKRGLPIWLLIDSPGGDVSMTYHIKDLIDRISSPVWGLVVGDAGSMAADLLQMCARRLMLPNALLFHHFTRNGFEFILRGNRVSERDIRDIVKRFQSNHDSRVALYRKRTGMTKRQVLDLFRQGEDAGIHINPREALKMKLIDKIETGFKFFPNH